MPDTKEKLVELLHVNVCDYDCEGCAYSYSDDECISHLEEKTADYLIANGVTIQEWISVEERLPEVGREVLATRNERDCFVVMYSDTYKGFFSGQFPVKGVTHWMPLPRPPKGD